MVVRDWRRANLLAREAVERMLMAILCPMLTAAVLIVVVRPENGLLGTPERLVALAVFAAYSLRAVSASVASSSDASRAGFQLNGAKPTTSAECLARPLRRRRCSRRRD